MKHYFGIILEVKIVNFIIFQVLYLEQRGIPSYRTEVNPNLASYIEFFFRSEDLDDFENVKYDVYVVFNR